MGSTRGSAYEVRLLEEGTGDPTTWLVGPDLARALASARALVEQRGESSLTLAALLLGVGAQTSALGEWLRIHLQDAASDGPIADVFLDGTRELGSQPIPCRFRAASTFHRANELSKSISVAPGESIGVRHVLAALPDHHDSEFSELSLDRASFLSALIHELGVQHPEERARWCDVWDGSFPGSMRPASGISHVVREFELGSEALSPADLELLMRRHNRRLFRTVRSIVQDDGLTEDLVQETYLSAFRHLHQYRGQNRFGAWISRIAVNHARAALRRRLPSSPLEVESMPAPASNPEQRAIHAQTYQELERAIDRLPDDFRTVLMLRVVEGLSTQETAEIVGIPEPTVKTRLHRARKLLQDALDRIDRPNDLYPFAGERCDRIVRRVLEFVAA